MVHTGYQDQKQDTYKPKLPTMLGHLSLGAETLGLTITWPEVAKARTYQERADQLRATYREHAAAGRERIIAASTDYAAGTIDAHSLIEQATSAAVLQSESGRYAAQMIEATAVAVEAEGAPLLYGISEAKWLKVLRPVVADALAEAQAVAEEIGIHDPRPRRRGVLEHAHPWAPTGRELQMDMALRHKWERLEAALTRLDEVYSYADTLRTWHLLPVVEGRTIREDYRWLRIDRLTGNVGRVREFFLANREVGEPGLYSAAEMLAAQVKPEPELNPVA